jgi:hypothetical protein
MCVEVVRVQQLKCIEEERCIEWTWRTEKKRQKNGKRNACVQEDSEADRAGKCRRSVMRLVCCY